MARILVYGLNYAPEPTGTGKYTGEMAAWLAARGHQVDAIAALPHYPAWSVDDSYARKGFHTESLDGVRVWRAPLFVPTADQLNARNRIRLETTYSANALRYWLPQLAGRRRYDVAIAVTPPLQIGVYPAIYRALRGVPWVLHVQDLQVDAAMRLGMLGAGRAGRLLYRIENFLLRRATRVSTITEAMRKRIVAKGTPADRTWLFPNWSDTQFIRPLPKDNEFRRSLGVADDQVVVLYAGNMGEKQGLELVLHAADRLRDDQSIRFVMVGDGAARERLQRSASERALSNLVFRPIQPVERLPAMLAAGDVHLVVQKREAADLVMPSKLTNILAAGRAVVATAEPGTALHDVVTEHGAGVATPPDDVDAFVHALRSITREPALRDDMGQKARVYAERYLDKDTILTEFEQKLLQLARKGGGAQL